jgi:hypothetical protein
MLKEILTSEPVLLIPNLLKPFKVHVDACRVGKGIGALLLQKNDNGDYQPVAYWSRGLTAAERNYSATELECTALHDTIIHWQVYLLNGLEFEVIVDHYALVYMVTKAGGAEAQQRLLRLCLDLQQFTFRVIHRNGVCHLVADAVSRLLGKDDQPYVRQANELCDDSNPLTDREKEFLMDTYGPDGKKLTSIIDEGRKRLIELGATRVQLLKRISKNPLPTAEKKVTIKLTKADQIKKAKIDENFVSKINAIHDEGQSLLIHNRIQKVHNEIARLAENRRNGS